MAINIFFFILSSIQVKRSVNNTDLERKREKFCHSAKFHVLLQKWINSKRGIFLHPLFVPLHPLSGCAEVCLLPFHSTRSFPLRRRRHTLGVDKALLPSNPLGQRPHVPPLSLIKRSFIELTYTNSERSHHPETFSTNTWGETKWHLFYEALKVKLSIWNSCSVILKFNFTFYWINK